jgi:hypothetical protein
LSIWILCLAQQLFLLVQVSFDLSDWHGVHGHGQYRTLPGFGVGNRVACNCNGIAHAMLLFIACSVEAIWALHIRCSVRFVIAAREYRRSQHKGTALNLIGDELSD